MQIRRLTPADTAVAAEIARLEQTCFADPWSENAVRESLSNPIYTFFVATDQERAVGYVGAYTIVGEMQITNVAVAPEARRRGLGDRLIDALIADAARSDVQLITLEVRASNEPAIRLYRKHGFCEVGRRPAFYSHPTEDAILMTLYLP